MGSVGSGYGRREEGRVGERCVADTWGQVAATAGGADGRAGVGGLLGWLAGPRARAEAGWPAWAEQAEPTRPSSSLFLFLFLISFPCLNFKFGLEFEFKTEVTCSL